jgi:hypothetical protein
MIEADQRNAEVIKPYIIGDDFLSETPPQATRYVIDFAPRDLFTAQTFPKPFKRVQLLVLGDRQGKLEKEEKRNKEAREDDPNARLNTHHATRQMVEAVVEPSGSAR